MAEKRLASQITVAEFAEVTFAAILRALEGRKVPRGPIIFGIIYTPEGLGERFGLQGGPAERT